MGSFESFLENYVISISDKESCSLLLVRVQQQVINRNCRNLSNKAVRPMAMIERGFVRSRQAEECCRTGDFVPNGQRRLTHALTTQIDPVEKPVLGPSDLSEASCPPRVLEPCTSAGRSHAGNASCGGLEGERIRTQLGGERQRAVGPQRHASGRGAPWRGSASLTWSRWEGGTARTSTPKAKQSKRELADACSE